MTKKDFELIAKVLKANMPAPSSNDIAVWLAIVTAMTNACATTNAAFKPAKFMVACGLKD